jgi:hypothetical protein
MFFANFKTISALKMNLVGCIDGVSVYDCAA